MSVADRYWSFKLLLQDKQDQYEDVESEEFSASSTSLPLISGLMSGSAGGPRCDDGNLIDGYGKFDFPELDAVEITPEHDAPEVPEVDSRKVRSHPVFVPPTQSQLNQLSTDDLRRLRREIARQIHPDLGDARSGGVDEDTMGRCNQMIDDAIRLKASAKT